MRHIVIIGNGIAGSTAARHIRKRSATDRITLISSETEHPYSRTALMYIYMGHLQYHHTKLYEDQFWANNRLELLRAQVDRIDFAARQLYTDAGNVVEYDLLILAVGSRPNTFGWKGETLAGVQGLYGMPDLAQLEAATTAPASPSGAVVVGGGLIGIELCEMLLARRVPTTFLVRESSYWRSVLPAEESALVTRHIREHAVDLRLNTELAEICDDGTGRVGSVVTSAGDQIPCTVVGLAVGVRPNIDWLRNSPLELDRGILVNERLETNLPGVYAIGDCVQHRVPPPGRKPLEQIWYTGRMMGETVAQTICGTPTTYQPGVFFNSAKFFDIEYQTYGNVAANLPPDGPEATFYWEHPDGRRAMRISYRRAEGNVVGMNALGIRQRQDVWTRWIEEGRSLHYVLTHLPEANFDPEFFERPETNVVAAYNRQHPDAPIEPLRRRSVWQRLFT